MLAFLIAGGEGGDALERNPFLARPLHDAHRAERDLGQLLVAFVRDLLSASPVDDGDVGRVLRVADRDAVTSGADADLRRTGRSQHDPSGHL